MKKYLHGKRHERARKSARIGRMNRKLARHSRLWNVELPRMIGRVCQVIDYALPKAIASMVSFSQSMSKLGDIGNGLSKVKPTAE